MVWDRLQHKILPNILCSRQQNHSYTLHGIASCSSCGYTFVHWALTMWEVQNIHGLCLVRSIICCAILHIIDILIFIFRVSATNNAHIYNEEHGDVSSRFPSGWPTTGRMTCPMVWDAFFIHSLLEEYSEMHRHLVLDNDQHQATRLSNAIRERNISAIGTGQEEWSHACDLCCVVEVQDNKACEYFTL